MIQYDSLVSKSRCKLSWKERLASLARLPIFGADCGRREYEGTKSGQHVVQMSAVMAPERMQHIEGS